MIKYKYARPLLGFLSAHFQFLFPPLPVDYLQCSEYTHILCLLLSHLLSLQGIQTPAQLATASLLSHYTNVRNM